MQCSITEDTKNNQIWERKRFHRKTVYHTKCRIAITSQAYFLINSKHWSREGGCIICTVRTNLYWLFLFAFGTLLLMACALPETTPTLLIPLLHSGTYTDTCRGACSYFHADSHYYLSAYTEPYLHSYPRAYSHSHTDSFPHPRPDAYATAKLVPFTYLGA